MDYRLLCKDYYPFKKSEGKQYVPIEVEAVSGLTCTLANEWENMKEVHQAVIVLLVNSELSVASTENSEYCCLS